MFVVYEDEWSVEAFDTREEAKKFVAEHEDSQPEVHYYIMETPDDDYDEWIGSYDPDDLGFDPFEGCYTYDC